MLGVSNNFISGYIQSVAESLQSSNVAGGIVSTIDRHVILLSQIFQGRERPLLKLLPQHSQGVTGPGDNVEKTVLQVVSPAVAIEQGKIHTHAIVRGQVDFLISLLLEELKEPHQGRVQILNGQILAVLDKAAVVQANTMYVGASLVNGSGWLHVCTVDVVSTATRQLQYFTVLLVPAGRLYVKKDDVRIVRHFQSATNNEETADERRKVAAPRKE